MAHGLAAERCFRLPAYAERFARAGLAVFFFDYRTFGDSQGEPRNWVSPYRHLQDWQNALEHVRSIPDIAFPRIGLWGSSLSGAHVIVTAAKDRRISAVSAQVPFVDDLRSMQSLGAGYLARAVTSGLRDLATVPLRRTPHRVPVVGKPDTFAVMNRPDSLPGYLALVPEHSSWENHCPARVFLSIMTYRPSLFASRISCPALVILAEQDSLISAAAVERMASRIPDGTLIRMPMGHFDIYQGEPFERSVGLQTEFFLRHLRKEG
jgi:pimeloyl-ACP methyl ester carboxylesterase